MRKKRSEVSMADVASLANTSTATVSRVLNNTGYPVREELRARILEVVQDMNYIPNKAARQLKTGLTKDIGVIIPTITNSFYAQLMSGIEIETRTKGYTPLFISSYRDPDIENKSIISLCEKCVDGIIISSINRDLQYIKRAMDMGIKLITFDQKVDWPECSSVTFDFCEGSYLAVEYLILKGHADIAFLSAPVNRNSRVEMLTGYIKALKQYNIKYDDSRVIATQSETEAEGVVYEFENGRQLARKFMSLQNLPTAVLAVNDYTAFGIIRELSMHSIAVPDDVSVVGFDNIDISSMVAPPLTTINQPAYETGRLAAKMLIERIEGKENKNTNILLKPSIMERKSVRQIII